jgi:GntR family transcriptional regulator/MocR family aminotransferase
MTRFIADGHLARHLRRTRKIYSERHRVVSEFLVHAVEQSWFRKFTPTCAGLHITATLPDGTDERIIRSAAEREGVAVGELASCWQSNEPAPGLIIGFGSIASDDLPEALHALSRAIGSSASKFATVDER